jgi:hypothetical protein
MLGINDQDATLEGISKMIQAQMQQPPTIPGQVSPDGQPMPPNVPQGVPPNAEV